MYAPFGKMCSYQTSIKLQNKNKMFGAKDTPLQTKSIIFLEDFIEVISVTISAKCRMFVNFC